LNKKVLGIVGMPGSGKSVAACVGRDLGFVIIVMGDVVRNEVIKRGLDLTPENMGQVMMGIRSKGGPSVVAERCIHKLEEIDHDKILIEGIRSLAEVETFKQHYRNFSLIAIHSSPETRFHRIDKRRRSDDPKKRRSFILRDRRELSLGIGSVIAMADHIIINEGMLSDYKKWVRTVLEEFLRESD
jgi:dephospho-CoA kinase